MKLLRKFVSTFRNEKGRLVFDHVAPRKKCKFSYFLYFLIKKKVFMNNFSCCSYIFIRMRDSMMLLRSIDVNSSYVFIIFIKKRIFNVFQCMERFYFLVVIFLSYQTCKTPTKPAKLLHKTTFK